MILSASGMVTEFSNLYLEKLNDGMCVLLINSHHDKSVCASENYVFTMLQIMLQTLMYMYVMTILIALTYLCDSTSVSLQVACG